MIMDEVSSWRVQRRQGRTLGEGGKGQRMEQEGSSRVGVRASRGGDTQRDMEH